MLDGLHLNLLGQLAGGGHDDSIRSICGHLLCHDRLAHDVHQHGQHKRSGLARACLCHTNDIPLLQPNGDGCSLDGRGLLVALREPALLEPEVASAHKQDQLCHVPGVCRAPNRFPKADFAMVPYEPVMLVGPWPWLDTCCMTTLNKEQIELPPNRVGM